MRREEGDFQVEVNLTLGLAGDNPGAVAEVVGGCCQVKGLKGGGTQAGRDKLEEGF